MDFDLKQMWINNYWRIPLKWQDIFPNINIKANEIRFRLHTKKRCLYNDCQFYKSDIISRFFLAPLIKDLFWDSRVIVVTNGSLWKRNIKRKEFLTDIIIPYDFEFAGENIENTVKGQDSKNYNAVFYRFFEQNDELVSVMEVFLKHYYNEFLILHEQQKDIIVPYDLWVDLIIFDDQKRAAIREKYAFCVSPGL